MWSLVKALKIVLIFLFLPVSFLLSAQSSSADEICTPLTTSPTIYQIDRNKDKATLFITPVSQASTYIIAYGLSEGDERYSITFNYAASTGAITYEISGLDEKQQYFYRIRGRNACSDGPWSAWVADKVAGQSTLLEAGSNTSLGIFAISGIAFLAGIFLFAF